MKPKCTAWRLGRRKCLPHAEYGTKPFRTMTKAESHPSPVYDAAAESNAQVIDSAQLISRDSLAGTLRSSLDWATGTGGDSNRLRSFVVSDHIASMSVYGENSESRGRGHPQRTLARGSAHGRAGRGVGRTDSGGDARMATGQRKLCGAHWLCARAGSAPAPAKSPAEASGGADAFGNGVIWCCPWFLPWFLQISGHLGV